MIFDLLFHHEGGFIDEVDLKEKYAKKQEQLESIMKTAKSFVHHNRNVRVYHDPEYRLSVW